MVLREKLIIKVRVGAEFNDVVKNINYFLKRNRETKKCITFIKTVNLAENKPEQDLLVKQWVNKVDYIVIQNQIIPQISAKKDGEFKEGYDIWCSPETLDPFKS